MSLPLGNGETIADAASRNAQLGDRITRAIPTYARVIKVEYGSGGTAQVEMELPLQEISKIVQKQSR
jgi:hypothetical protein